MTYFSTTIYDAQGNEFDVTLDIEGYVEVGGSNSHGSDEPEWEEVHLTFIELVDYYGEDKDGNVLNVPENWHKLLDETSMLEHVKGH